ncbi:uncharacterized protein [Glycine max]|uniref:uncharacterized protein n=1 Tax=Glycine max TaxID=3847 RepID=UPI001B35444B|nr:uncharacterized protein LOC100782571 [Glycine max]
MNNTCVTLIFRFDRSRLGKQLELQRKMNSAIFKVSNSNDINSSFRAALFHSTPPLQRKRRNHWDSVPALCSKMASRSSSRLFQGCSRREVRALQCGLSIFM